MKRKLLLAALCVVGAIFGSNSLKAQQAPQANGIYYLYNTACTDGTPGFMSTGNGYGFQVVIDNFGFPVKLIDAGDGNFKFQFIHHEGYLSDDGWMYSDGGTERARTITIQPQNDGTYRLYNTNNSTWIEDWYGNVVGDGTENRHNYKWQFLSKAERDAMIAGYTKNQKMAAASSMGISLSEQTSEAFDAYISANYIALDQSSKIQNGTFDTSNSTDGWATSANSNRTFNIGWGNTDPKTTPEVYEGAGSISQTITVDKVGLYKVSVNATYRCGNKDNNNRIGNLGYDGSVAYLKANDNFTKIDDWYSGKINGNGPDSPSEANSVYFSQGKYLSEVYVYVGDTKTIEISIHSHAFTWGGWLMFNNFKLTYYSDEVADDDATAILSTATTLEGQEMDATIKSNLNSAKSTFDGAHTIANYNALQTAITAAQESADAYALFAVERTKARALGMTAEAIATYAPDVQALMVAEYNYVTTNYAYSVDLGTWTTSNAVDRSSQHWDGTTKSTYSEQNEGWGNDSWSCSYSQDLTLPAGDYVFKVAGRKSSDAATITLEVKNGLTVLGTVNDFPNGDTGKGIDTSGATNFGEGTFAKNPNHQNDDLEGCGWQWRYVQFSLADPATVNVSVSASATAKFQWVGFCNATVQTNDADNVALMEALVALNSAKTEATLSKITANVGTGVFQYKESTNNSLWSAYETAKTDAESYTFTSSSTTSEVNTLATALNNAISNYKSQALNAPDASKRYTLTIVQDGKDWNGNAVTFLAGARSDMGGYGIKYLTPANANMNQALKFTAVDGETNTYKVSAINVADGGERYITTGTTYPDVEGNNNAQIRTTDDASKASWVKIQATATEGQFQLLNVSDGNKVIANNNNNDMYTANSANFTIAEASQATVGVSVAAGKYATRIFPFTPTLPTGVVAYSCAAVNNETLTLDEVTTFAANVPYILYSENGVSETNLTGWGTASAVSYEAGLLTGVYTNAAVPAGKYVLQTQGGVQGFYQVDDEEEFTAIPNRAYLTLPDAPSGGDANVRALFFPAAGEATGIEAIGVLTSGNYDGIYTAGGAKVNSLQKGLNIVVKDGKSYKIFVK